MSLTWCGVIMFFLPFAYIRNPNACDRERISVRRLIFDYKRIRANWIYLDNLFLTYYNKCYEKSGDWKGCYG